jgi:pSer/pThr/pTyr-binding forkhead associated (FHA) protein
MPAPSLEIVIDENSSWTFPIEKQIVRIGRAADNDVVLSDDTRHVSRWHAIIRHDGRGPVVLSDLKSVNGTFLNGRPIALPVPIFPNDTIKIGKFRLVLRERV